MIKWVNFYSSFALMGCGDIYPGLCRGMTFTIEPMINLGKRDIRSLPDGWTIVTKDHKLSAQWEYTILVTETGYEVLTARKEEKMLYFHL